MLVKHSFIFVRLNSRDAYNNCILIIPLMVPKHFMFLLCICLYGILLGICLYGFLIFNLLCTCSWIWILFQSCLEVACDKLWIRYFDFHRSNPRIHYITMITHLIYNFCTSFVYSKSKLHNDRDLVILVIISNNLI